LVVFVGAPVFEVWSRDFNSHDWECFGAIPLRGGRP
jgi:hypothetical protein